MVVLQRAVTNELQVTKSRVTRIRKKILSNLQGGSGGRSQVLTGVDNRVCVKAATLGDI